MLPGYSEYRAPPTLPIQLHFWWHAHDTVKLNIHKGKQGNQGILKPWDHMGVNVHLHSLPALPLGKRTLDYPFNRRVGWIQNQSGYFRDEINLMSIRNEPQFLGHPVHSLVITLTIYYPGS